MATEIDKYIFSLVLDSKGFKVGEKQALLSIKNITKSLKSAALVTGAVMAGKYVWNLANSFKDLNIEVGQFSKRTGESIHTVERWGKVIEKFGFNKQKILADVDSFSKMMNSPWTRPEAIQRAMRVGVPYSSAVTAKTGTDLLLKMRDSAWQKYNRDPAAFSSELQQIAGLSESTVDFFLRVPNLRAEIAKMKSNLTPQTMSQSKSLQESMGDLNITIQNTNQVLGKIALGPIGKFIEWLNSFIQDISNLKPDPDISKKGWLHAIWRYLSPSKERANEWGNAAEKEGLNILAGALKNEYKPASGKEEEILNIAVAAALAGGSSFTRGIMTSDKSRLASVKARAGGIRPLKAGEDVLTANDLEPAYKELKAAYESMAEWGQFLADDAVTYANANMATSEYFNLASKFGIKTKGMGFNAEVWSPLKNTAKDGALELLRLKQSGPAIDRSTADLAAKNMVYAISRYRPYLYGIGAEFASPLTQAWRMSTSQKMRELEAGGTTINVESPEYNINITTENPDPKSISQAARTGAQQANSGLATTIRRGMGNQTYSGPGYGGRVNVQS